MPVPVNQFAFTRGSTALYALLIAVGIRPGDEVIVPVYTCTEVLRPIAHLKARPVFCDIEVNTFGVCEAELATKITPLTRAILIQHTFGIPSPVNAALRSSQLSRISLIEDCCHVPAFGPGTEPMGTIGDASFYSFGYGKPLSLGGGGLAITNSDWLTEKMSAIYPTFSLPSMSDSCFATLKALKSSIKRSIPPGIISHIKGVKASMQRPDPQGPISYSSDPRLAVDAKRMCAPCSSLFGRLVRYKSAQITGTRRWAASYYERGFHSIDVNCLNKREQNHAALWRYPIWARKKDVVLAEARRKRAPIFDWGAWPLSALRFDHAADGCFPIARQVTDHVVTVAIDETKDCRTIDSTLEFLSNMKNRGAL